MTVSTRSETYKRYSSAAIASTSSIEDRNEGAIISELAEAMHVSVAAIYRRKAGQIDDTFTEIIAKMGIRRGMLTRTWLEIFLRAANYPDREALIDALFPDTLGLAPPHLVLTNLPPPSYSHFVMRTEQYTEIVEALHRHGMVVVLGAGGMGKSTLALEIARRSLSGARSGAEPAPPTCDAAVWTSDRAQPGRLDLSTVLDTLVRVLGVPQLTNRPLETKRDLVDQLLRQRRVLLIADNLDTVVGNTLLHWLMTVPEPSKVIITTRNLRMPLIEGASLVRVDTMHKSEGHQLLTQRARELQLDQVDPQTINTLLVAAGGNPKALTLLLGQLRLGYPLERVLNTIHNHRGELLADLFERGWTLLDDDARQIFIAATAFYAPPEQNALAAVAALPPDRLEPAIQTLLALSLLDYERREWQTEQSHVPVRFTMHPLARQYAAAQLRERPEIAQRINERWLAWCVAFAREQGGFTIDTVTQLAALEAVEPDLDAALEIASSAARHRDVIALARGVEFLYYVTAQWGKKIRLHERYIQAAHDAGDTGEEIYALALHIQLLSRQGRPHAADAELSRLIDLAGPRQSDPSTFFTLQHTRGLHALAMGQLADAEACWQTVLTRAMDLEFDMLHAARHWIGRVLQLQGATAASRAYFEQAYAIAQTNHVARFTARNLLRLAELDIAEGRPAHASERLDQCRLLTPHGDAELQAGIHLATARLCILQGQAPAAAHHYSMASTLFKRMDMEHEWRDAEAKLAASGSV